MGTCIDGGQPQSSANMDMASASGSSPELGSGQVNFSKWRTLDSRSVGITRSMISQSSSIVLKVLQKSGFEAYLVGGCVRDLLLNRVPKDFDVITSAGLNQIRKKFYNAIIVGRRYPICMVPVKGSVVEVSSFQTVHKQSKRKQLSVTKMPVGCTQGDFARWKNCMERDFTINCLYFDPLRNKIFDYTNAIMDLKSLKLETVIPAHLSFKVDQARILRGLRLSARLNFSFSSETEATILDLSPSIAGLEKARLRLELNYMLSYGAAEPSLLLLKRFKLLEIFLPCHALYLAEQEGKQQDLRSSMLMKLFFNLDELITCDRPCNARLWVAILAFHLALVNNPQHAVVVLTLASVLYRGKWKDSVKFAREHAGATCIFVPEVLDASHFLSDDEIAERVTQFVVQVRNSIDLLVDYDCLLKAIASVPDFPCSGVVFLSKKMGRDVESVFNTLKEDTTSFNTNRNSPEIDYCLLGKGDVSEVRFVLGKIILNTLCQGNIQEREATERKVFGTQANDLPQNVEFKKIERESTYKKKGNSISKDGKKQGVLLPNNKLLTDDTSKTRLLEDSDDSGDIMIKNQETVVGKQTEDRLEIKHDSSVERNFPDIAKKRFKVSGKENVCLPKDCWTDDTERVESFGLPQGAVGKMLQNVEWQHKSTSKKQKVAEKEYQRSPKRHMKFFEEMDGNVSQKKPLPAEKYQSVKEERIEQQLKVVGNESCDRPTQEMGTVENDKLGKGQTSGPKLSVLFK